MSDVILPAAAPPFLAWVCWSLRKATSTSCITAGPYKSQCFTQASDSPLRRSQVSMRLSQLPTEQRGRRNLSQGQSPVSLTATPISPRTAAVHENLYHCGQRLQPPERVCVCVCTREAMPPGLKLDLMHLGPAGSSMTKDGLR